MSHPSAKPVLRSLLQQTTAVAMEQSAHAVFISYAHADRDWVTIAVNLLKAGGAKVFMDVRDIAYGDNWEHVLLEKRSGLLRGACESLKNSPLMREWPHSSGESEVCTDAATWPDRRASGGAQGADAQEAVP